MGARASALLAALVASACSGAETRFVERPDSPDALEFIVHLRQGRLIRTWNPVDLESGVVELQPEPEDVIIHIAIDPGALTAIDPLFVADAPGSLELSRRAPCSGCERACVDANLGVSTRLPLNAAISELVDDAFIVARPEIAQAIRGDFRLELTGGTQSCNWGSGYSLRPFPATDQDLIGPIEGITPLDDDRVFISAPYQVSLMLVIRGRDRDDNFKRLLRASDLGHNVLGAFRVTTVTSTSARIVILGASDEANPLKQSGIYELEVTDDGFRRLRTIATLEGTFRGLDLTDSGGVIAVGDGGAVATSSDGVSFHEYRLAGGKLSTVRDYTAEVGKVFMGGSLGFVAEGDPFSGSAGMEQGNLASATEVVDSSVTGIQLRSTPDGVEVWASTPGQGIYKRRNTGVWESGLPEAPWGVRACQDTPDECGRSLLIGETEGLTFADNGTLFFVNSDCSTFFTRDWASNCTGYADFDGAPQLVSGGITAIVERDGKILVGKGSRLYELAP